MQRSSADQDFILGLTQVIETGSSLLRHLAVASDRPVPSPAELKTVEEAKTAGVLAAVQAVTTLVGPLCVRRSPTLAQGEEALQTLKRLSDVWDGYHAAFHSALTDLCLQLEEVLDEQRTREAGSHETMGQ